MGTERHSEETRELALTTLALAGDSPTKAVDMLRDAGVRVSRNALQKWREKYADRYQQIRDTRVAEIEREVVRQTRTLVTRYTELELQLVDLIAKQAQDGTLKDPSTAARNASVSKGINVDKMLLIEGRPTEIVHRSSEDVLRALAAKGYIEGTADELPAELPPAAHAAFRRQSDSATP